MAQALTDGAVPEWTRGERLAKARRLAGFSQAQMAGKLGVKESTLASWETGRARPRDFEGTMARWAAETGVSLPWLYGLNGCVSNPDLELLEPPVDGTPIEFDFDWVPLAKPALASG